MHKGDDQETCSLSSERISGIAYTNDGTLNAVVSKAVCSVDVPIKYEASSSADEMLCWLHYPPDDCLERGYCHDMFGDLPSSSAQLVRNAMVNELGSRPQNASLYIRSPSLVCAKGFHEKTSSSSVNIVSVQMSDSAREVVESCGSGPWDNADFRVAGADAVPIPSACQVEDKAILHRHADVYSELAIEGEGWKQVQMERRQSSPVEMEARSQSFGSEATTQNLSQQPRSFANISTLSCTPESMNRINGDIDSGVGEMLRAANFSLFARPAMESENKLHALAEDVGLTGIPERARQQEHFPVLSQESAATVDVGAIQPKVLPPLPQPTPSLVLKPSCSSVASEWSPSGSQTLPLTRRGCEDDALCTKERATCSIMSRRAADECVRASAHGTTSSSRCSGNSTERSSKLADVTVKRKIGVEDDSDKLTKNVQEPGAGERRASITKRMRTAEMHNQSERKRRVKINDRLRTLQQLIPNCNKPDKASLLDAVIEYIKLLQAQLQMVSISSGIAVPSWILPNSNMNNMYLPTFAQMSIATDMAMGMGLDIQMRMGMTSMGSGCAVMPVPLCPTPSSSPYPSRMASLQSVDHLQYPISTDSPNIPNFCFGPTHFPQV
ncbi:hypothetical protein KP509_13G024600 [Ceratopteris richardii]|uniref:BHLH domain-containing protein n=1 Tax=Ceratopteris richardii TaxID=49495 RepID=A0A8T2TG67_CERRI|nr:hypothetical protein KP509_13G024600 [Ceratopteris richardii]